MKEREAVYTFDEKSYKKYGYCLYYFHPKNRRPPPYLKQVHVHAIIDIADDGTLAGIELIESMPLPPKDNE